MGAFLVASRSFKKGGEGEVVGLLSGLPMFEGEEKKKREESIRLPYD